VQKPETELNMNDSSSEFFSNCKKRPIDTSMEEIRLVVMEKKRFWIWRWNKLCGTFWNLGTIRLLSWGTKWRIIEATVLAQVKTFPLAPWWKNSGLWLWKKGLIIELNQDYWIFWSFRTVKFLIQKANWKTFEPYHFLQVDVLQLGSSFLKKSYR